MKTQKLSRSALSFCGVLTALTICLLIVTFSGGGKSPAPGTGGDKSFFISCFSEMARDFTPDEFEMLMDISRGSMKNITIVSPPTSGELRLSGKEITAGQKISRGNIENLSYIIREGAASDCMTIFVNNSNLKATVTLLKSNPGNREPRTSAAAFGAFPSIPIFGDFTVTDREADPVFIKLVEKPKKGTVTISGTGFQYEAYAEEKGEDSFSFVAVDSFGALSNESVVTVTLHKRKTDAIYSDLKGSRSQYAALRLHDENIMKGEMAGSLLFFRPNEKMTAGEYIAVLVKTVGGEEKLTACVNTGLPYDNEISSALKPYIKYASDNGLLESAEFSSASGEITKAQAVAAAARALGLPNVKTANLNFPDLATIPDFAMQSFMNLCENGILENTSSEIRPNEKLTRAAAAELILSLWEYRN